VPVGRHVMYDMCSFPTVLGMLGVQENEGQGQFLPLDGSIPDMHATTE
jgi:hypothetical protein